MSRSRRDFLKQGTLVALAAGVPLSLAEKAFAMGTASSAAVGLSMASFKSQVGTSFLVNEETSKVKVTLVEVDSFASRQQSAAGKEGFSLIFRGPRETILKQNTYRMEHQELGVLSLLVVPVRTADTRAAYYQAVVNRLTP